MLAWIHVRGEHATRRITAQRAILQRPPGLAAGRRCNASRPCSAAGASNRRRPPPARVATAGRRRAARPACAPVPRRWRRPRPSRDRSDWRPSRRAEAARADRQRREQRVIEAAEAHADDQQHRQAEPRGDVEHVASASEAATSAPPAPSTTTASARAREPRVGGGDAFEVDSRRLPAPPRDAARSAARTQYGLTSASGAATLPAAIERRDVGVAALPGRSPRRPVSSRPRARPARRARAAAPPRRASCRRRCRCR